MKRIQIRPRLNWESVVEKQGLHFHHHDDKKQAYWDESAYYAFNMSQINNLERATNEVYQMYIDTVQHILDERLLSKLGIPEKFHNLIYDSWERDDLSLYGRFDFWFDGIDIKLFEFNGDTPTSLFEAAVIQWEWLEERFPDMDQFNSIHESLIDSWKYIADEDYTQPFYFASVKNHIEDYTTVTYLRDTAEQAGIETDFLHVQDIGWNSEDQEFRDTNENTIETLFKLYPWEWMINEGFGDNLLESETSFIEPIWKLVMSNKGIMAIMYELYPDSPYLLPTYFENKKHLLVDYVKKPIFSREGANIEIVENGQTVHSEDGDYGYEGYVYQELKKLVGHEDENGTIKYPVIGSWVIGGEACGMGIRESVSLITNNGSSFVPHIIL
jgi:glutathionylspermidine synthase